MFSDGAVTGRINSDPVMIQKPGINSRAFLFYGIIEPSGITMRTPHYREVFGFVGCRRPIILRNNLKIPMGIQNLKKILRGF